MGAAPTGTPPAAHALRLRGRATGLLCWGGGPDGLPATGQRRALLVHGFLDQAATWHAVGARLAAAGLCALAPDHRGHGQSAHAAPGHHYAFPEYVADLDALVSALPPGPLTLVGHSMGGTVAALWASLRPDRVAALVLVDGLGPPTLSDDDAIDTYQSFLDDQAAPPPEAKRLPDRAAVLERLARLMPGLDADTLALCADRGARPHPEGGWAWTQDPMHRTRSAIAFDQRRFLVHLARITCPTTLIFGATGWYPQAVPVARRVEALRQVAGVHELRCGHNVHVEQAEVLARLVVGAAGGSAP
jgi:pimeloyl-ACP methyl ester carboxylesterase